MGGGARGRRVPLGAPAGGRTCLPACLPTRWCRALDCARVHAQDVEGQSEDESEAHEDGFVVSDHYFSEDELHNNVMDIDELDGDAGQTTLDHPEALSRRSYATQLRRLF